MDKMNVFPLEESSATEAYHARWAETDLTALISDTPDSPDEAMLHLSKERQNVPVTMLQSFVNLMLKYGVYKKEVLVDLAYTLYPEYSKWKSDSANNIFYCNVVKPLQDMIVSPNFSWDAALSFIDAGFYLGDVVKYFTLSSDAFSLVLTDVREGIELKDLKYYTVHSSPGFNEEECSLFPDVAYYGVYKQLLDVNTHEDIISTYAGRIPAEALVPLAILSDLGAPVAKIEAYSDSFKSDKFWKERLALESINDASKEKLGLNFVKNFFAIYQLIFGEFLEMYGEEPMLSFGTTLIGRDLRKSRLAARSTPFRYDHKVYFSNSNDTFSCTEGNLPYIWGTMTSKLIAALNHPVLDTIVDFAPVNGRKSTSLIVIQASQKSYMKPKDHYSPFALEQIFAEMSLDDFSNTITRYLTFAKQVNCYDFYLLAMIDVFFRDKLNYTKWIKAYMMNPLAFSAGFINALVAYMLGADDFREFFECTEPGWYQSYLELADGFRPTYNFSAACFVEMQIKTGLYIKEFNNVNLDYEFPSEITLRSRTGEERVIEFRNMITNDKYYHKLYTSMMGRNPICFRDTNGAVVVTERGC